MGNKKGLIWYLTLFYDKEKTEIFKVIECSTIKEMSYYLNIPSQVISNYYHKQIKERDILVFCKISQNLNL